MARPGRPRDPDAKRRRRTTRASRAAEDTGATPELLAHRRRVSGDAAVAADFPLDVLAARSRRDPATGLSPPEVEAGWRFARLAWALGRAPVPLPPRFWAERLPREADQPVRSEEEREAAAMRTAQRYRTARAALAVAGPGAVRAVDGAAVALEMPGDPARLAALRAGLQSLARHFGFA
ncbi:hypothetical protein STAQ_11510 [Allostella sp. ATCC 35155]|nr:hypothetical protein STAQ_11510 [Stella sp. ATCC 35155]